jgi:hypothetical protein
MKLFWPSARATNALLIVGFAALGYALYFRYLVVEQTNVGLACQAGQVSWLCTTRQIVTTLFNYEVFGWVAVIVGSINLLRPSLALFGVALSAALAGLVLYNGALASLGASLLLLSFARREPEPE